MKPLQFVSRTLVLAGLALALSLAVASAQSAKSANEFQPEVGQAGKDVIWVPTPQALVNAMLDVAKVTADDFVVDLGSGDGRTVITAAKRGAKALGVEYNPDMVELSKRAAAKEGVSGKASFVRGDLFQTDFSQATVVTMFLLQELNLRLRPRILDMKPGTRVVSNTFNMGDWTPDATIDAVKECTSYCRAYYWVVPAKVAGTWSLPQGELKLEQSYQMITGTLKAEGHVRPVTGRLNGEQIIFTVGDTQYTGRVVGNAIEGISQTTASWRATRSGT
jgi:SAM-dependent methyltransferase